MLRRLVQLLVAAAFGFSCTAPRADALEPVAVAEGVYAFIGRAVAGDAETRIAAGNSGFIVGRDGVIVVDTGNSFRFGRGMVDAIRRVTDRPIVLVVITHAAQEFVFGSAAFADLQVPLLAHVQAVELMRRRCERCLQNLQRALGAETMAGTRLVIPQRIVDASTVLDLAGRRVELLDYGWASAPGDVAVYDVASGALFAGGLVTNRWIPELRDAKLDGWLRALGRLADLRPRVVVPGFGAPAGPQSIDDTARYLRALDEKVRQLYRDGASLQDTVDNSDLPEYAGWTRYPSLQRQNASYRYLQLELEELEQ